MTRKRKEGIETILTDDDCSSPEAMKVASALDEMLIRHGPEICGLFVTNILLNVMVMAGIPKEEGHDFFGALGDTFVKNYDGIRQDIQETINRVMIGMADTTKVN